MKYLAILILFCFFFSNIVGSSFAAKTAISAESRVRGLAIKSENDRKSAGMMMGGAGGLMLISGLALGANQNGVYGSYSSSMLGLLLILEGAVFLAGGAASYLIPTGIENDYINISKVDNSAGSGRNERESLAESSLKNRSEESSNGRMWGSALMGGAGLLYSTMGSPYSAVGLLYGGVAAYSWFNKTDVEREYEQYLGDKGLVSKKLTINNTDEELLNEMLSGEAR